MARYISQDEAARLINIHPRTVTRWLTSGYITGYSAGPRDIRVDLDEIESQLLVNPHMRDGRRPLGPRARVVPMPVTTQPLDADEVESAGQAVS